MNDFQCKYSLLQGHTPLNNRLIEIHVIRAENNLFFLPKITSFWTFWMQDRIYHELDVIKNTFFPRVYRLDFQLRSRDQPYPLFDSTRKLHNRFRLGSLHEGLYCEWNQILLFFDIPSNKQHIFLYFSDKLYVSVKTSSHGTHKCL